MEQVSGFYVMNFFSYSSTVASQKYAHPPFSLKVIAKGHLLLEWGGPPFEWGGPIFRREGS